MFLQNSEGKFLVLKRNLETYAGVKGVWDIVGGRIDPGTSLMENLAREVREETQLSLTGEPRLVAAQDIIPSAERHIVRLTYVGRAEGDPVLDPKEHLEYAWLSHEELAKEEGLDVYAREVLGKLTD